MVLLWTNAVVFPVSICATNKAQTTHKYLAVARMDGAMVWLGRLIVAPHVVQKWIAESCLASSADKRPWTGKT